LVATEPAEKSLLLLALGVNNVNRGRRRLSLQRFQYQNCSVMSGVSSKSPLSKALKPYAETASGTQSRKSVMAAT
jgi:hypothetical protein